ncbi:acyl-CoA reductase [Solitalea canadensis]|uniref:Acyl-CoA reductase (LuxC) n=1 Tax=Solitalea canadensis (strain ATCC 29591 / DSM 3403 / JCM 21819 / LMG 8368 / NBRC 15130 / NCIMB 12057 / USAM 9D) TaxID=929556 RepID=H8KV29_SOLCM|nr:acyl-CoA reductase [Solitalea canadensis]AFD06029.1 Acyl-CoA reductase (LuxC) [Solitalea canadensis DSM 3403]
MPHTSINDTVKTFASLGKVLFNPSDELNSLINSAEHYNTWFTPDYTKEAILAIARSLSEENLSKWLSAYTDKWSQSDAKTVGLILAGNIPLVGFHDILCVLISGHKALIKLSSQDNKLIPYILKELIKINPIYADKFEFIERLNVFDAVIATGSNNSSRYFDHYFGKYPHIIRKNRNSVAVLTGNETPEDFNQLGKDIFWYFGLGCRNVSKLYVPNGYSFIKFFEGIESYKPIIYHNKYANNFDYNLTLLMMNRIKYYENNFLMLSENAGYASPISSLHYEFYEDEAALKQRLKDDAEQIQCVVSKGGSFGNSLPFGKAQQPELWDYADGVDTMEFLLEM